MSSGHAGLVGAHDCEFLRSVRAVQVREPTDRHFECTRDEVQQVFELVLTHALDYLPEPLHDWRVFAVVALVLDIGTQILEVNLLDTADDNRQVLNIIDEHRYAAREFNVLPQGRRET